MNSDNPLQDTKTWFEIAVPSPTDKNRAVQLGVHWEEIGEMLEATYDDPDLKDSLEELSFFYKTRPALEKDNVNRKELLDSLIDQIVTAVGVAHMFGMDIIGALGEGNRSNFSKFVDGKPLFDENGKIKKGPNYFKPNLEPYLEK